MAEKKENEGGKGEASGAGVMRDPDADVRFQIRTPALGFTGERAGVNFRDGVGHTDDESQARACVSMGYFVIDRKRKTVMGARFEMRAARNDFDGVAAGVKFRDGVAYTADERTAVYLNSIGFEVEELKPGHTIRTGDEEKK